MVGLSIIILSYNTKSLTIRCIESLLSQLQKEKDIFFEIVVVDNASKDGSVEALKAVQELVMQNKDNKHIQLKLSFNKQNVGYPRGNNQGLAQCKGTYILFLNSDVIVESIRFSQLLEYLDKNPSVGALTVKVNLAPGTIDPASHRGFPTLWNSFCYFSGLEKLTRTIPFLKKIFGGYHLVQLDLKTIHEIDSPTGAFYMTRKSILAKLHGFDEDYFMYGEDIDLSYRIKKLNYTIIYYPLFQVTHLKYASGLDKSDDAIRTKTRKYFYDAMNIFYKKHYEDKYPAIINSLVHFFINLKKAYV